MLVLPCGSWDYPRKFLDSSLLLLPPTQPSVCFFFVSPTVRDPLVPAQYVLTFVWIPFPVLQPSHWLHYFMFLIEIVPSRLARLIVIVSANFSTLFAHPSVSLIYVSPIVRLPLNLGPMYVIIWFRRSFLPLHSSHNMYYICSSYSLLSLIPYRKYDIICTRKFVAQIGLHPIWWYSMFLP